jgi:hypothetical protein
MAASLNLDTNYLPQLMDEVEGLPDEELEMLTIFVIQLRHERASYYRTHPERKPKKLFAELDAYLGRVSSGS